MLRKKFLQLSALATIGANIPKSIASTFMQAPPEIDHKVIIIGSGYGAAVTALRLTEKGIPVVILEMGMDWPTNKKHNTFSKLLSADHRSAWLKNRSIAPFANIFTFKKYTGVLDRLEFDNMKIYVGRGVGGGSLVNGGMAVVPRRDYFETVMPNINATEMYEKYFPLANKMLKTNDIDHEFFKKSKYYKFTRTAEIQAHKAGLKTVFVPNVYDFKYMEKEDAGTVYKSALGGEVIYGNNAGKNSLDKTYLAEAFKTGLLTILPLHELKKVSATDKGYRLDVDCLGTDGYVEKRKIFTCKHLFLGAGSVGTTGILLKAKAEGGLAKLNDEIGKSWGNNGNVMSGRNFVKQGTGVKQSTIPVKAIDDWDNEKHPVFAEISPLPMNLETWTTLYLAITKNPNYGQFTYNLNSKSLQLNLPKDFTKKSVEDTRQLIDKLNKANGGTISHLLFHNGIGDDICYHPLGGCVLGKGSDFYGRVKNYKNLYAIDGSMIPGSTGVNPFVTITALAERNIAQIIIENFQ